MESGSKDDLVRFMTANKLEIINGSIVAKDKNRAKLAIDFWDKKQTVRKLNLNGLYGALLNPGCRYFDQRIGQSTTLTGRCIAKHMHAYTNEVITGEYDYLGKSVIYGDTDSLFFSAWPVLKDAIESGQQEWNRDICVELFDSIAEQVNNSFPAFMEQAFHCTRKHGELIKAGRELVASSGLFITKKRYAVLIYDLEEKRLDVLSEEDAKKNGALYGLGKVKAMGLDLKRADTPKLVQDFLSNILVDVLTTGDREVVVNKIVEFKTLFTNLPVWEKGTPKRVNNLTSYGDKIARGAQGMVPGHVTAAINWNKLREIQHDRNSPKIVDGMKTIVLKLKSNPMGMTSIGYPIDIAHIPQWFKDLPFDHELMIDTVVNKKIDNLLGVLNWEISHCKTTFTSLFVFG